MATRLKRGRRYRIGDTGLTVEINQRWYGYVIRCGEKNVATRTSRKAALAWAKRNAKACRR